MVHSKCHLKIVTNFIFSKDTDEVRVMHWKNDNIGIMIYDKADEVILNQLFLVMNGVVSINECVV